MKKITRALLLIGILASTFLYIYGRESIFTPRNLESDKIIFRVEKDEAIGSVTKRLEDVGVVASARLLRLYLSWQSYDTKLAQGEFHFLSPISLREVALLLTQKPAKPLYVVTIPEGSDNNEVAEYFSKKNSKLSKEKILAEIEKKNAPGYLYPDTYFLSGKENENEVIQKMLVNFKTKYKSDEHIGQVALGTMLSDQKIRRHLSVASILEGEANNQYDMQVVAGILLKREKLGMKLQVDAAKETYTRKGFPEIPINNPGYVSLYAAEHPLTTPYLYYITGKDGKMYYAKNFTEHKKNIAKYL
jgi:UPF0755 protein